MASRKKSKNEPLYMSPGTNLDITSVSACFDHVSSTVFISASISPALHVCSMLDIPFDGQLPYGCAGPKFSSEPRFVSKRAFVSQRESLVASVAS